MIAATRARRALCTALAAACLLASLAGCGGKPPEETAKPTLKYATEGVTAVEDADALQKAVDDMYAKAAEGTIDLEYRNEAISSDGTNFTCYIANAATNEYDMFISIYSDDTLEEELYLSGLITPGQAFSTVALSKPLPVGDHTVYTAFTQVEEDLETIHAQLLVTMTFTVK